MGTKKAEYIPITAGMHALTDDGYIAHWADVMNEEYPGVRPELNVSLVEAVWPNTLKLEGRTRQNRHVVIAASHDPEELKKLADVIMLVIRREGYLAEREVAGHRKAFTEAAAEANEKHSQQAKQSVEAMIRRFHSDPERRKDSKYLLEGMEVPA